MDFQVLFPLLAQAPEQAADAAAQVNDSGSPWLTSAIVLAVLILPWFVGKFLAKSLRMPDYGLRLGVIVFALTVGSAIVGSAGGKPKLGVDLKGGVILHYQIEETDKEVDMGAMAAAISERINPSGTNEIVVRPYGDKEIEIIVPEVDPNEVEDLKEKIVAAGVLEFMIMADFQRHADIIETARDIANSASLDRRKKYIREGGTEVAYWAQVGRAKEELPGGIRPFRTLAVLGGLLRDASNGKLLELPADQSSFTEEERGFERWLKENNIEEIDVLMALDPDPEARVTGTDLAVVTSGYADLQQCVNFRLTGAGAIKFSGLTGDYLQDNVTGKAYQLGIVMDEKLISAPAIRGLISDNGQITGNFTEEEIKFLVDILNAGSLPTTLQKIPISENLIGSTLGAGAIADGTRAVSISLIAVLLFILCYYRFSGIVACFSLAANIVLILALMILIKAPLTLPGIAGLVLTVGMSVDANVLIFERIREELSRGAALRMAIRNGFGRATTTIVDANLTTLITGIVLYVIGTDQIRGFAVTLVFGILMSMFTAIYCARAFFEIAERKRWISQLHMMRFLGATRIDFIGKRYIAGALSLLVIVAGLTAVAYRGSKIFDIDFTGGTSVTMVMAKPMSDDVVRQRLDNALKDAKENNSAIQYSLYEINDSHYQDDQVWQVVSSFQEVKSLKDKLREEFAKDLQYYSVAVSDVSLLQGAESGAAATQTPAAEAQSRRADLPGDDVLAFAQDAAVPGTEQSDIATDASANALDAATEEPAATEPAATEPAATEPAATEPAATEPAATEPEATEPEATEPEATEPGATEPAATEPGATEPAEAEPATVWSQAQVNFPDKINAPSLTKAIVDAAAKNGITLSDSGNVQLAPQGDGAAEYQPGSSASFQEWTLQIAATPAQTKTILAAMRETYESQPVWPSSSKVGSKVAGDMKTKAVEALVTSILCIVAYIWIRFQRVVFGLAAVVALVHDVLITLGAIALSYWLARALGFLLIEEFKISLTVLAAFLTIIGYSLNDTIVIFDRIREVRGKSPDLTIEMVNTSINQTLSRTILTSFTTLLVVLILYAIGGQGIHGFAFALVVGVFVGTYSTIFVASPCLLWMYGGKSRSKESRAAA